MTRNTPTATATPIKVARGIWRLAMAWTGAECCCEGAMRCVAGCSCLYMGTVHTSVPFGIEAAIQRLQETASTSITNHLVVVSFDSGPTVQSADALLCAFALVSFLSFAFAIFHTRLDFERVDEPHLAPQQMNDLGQSTQNKQKEGEHPWSGRTTERTRVASTTILLSFDSTHAYEHLPRPGSPSHRVGS